MSDQQAHTITWRVRAIAGVQPWRVLACLAVFLAAVALTYGWDMLTRASHAVPMLPFGVRATFSAALIFLGAFALTGLWLPPAGNVPSIEAAPAFVVAPAAQNEREDGQDNGADLLPPHIPVRAADLPRILFDTNELPAVTAPNTSDTPRKNATNPPGRAIRPPVAWPRPPAADE